MDWPVARLEQVSCCKSLNTQGRYGSCKPDGEQVERKEDDLDKKAFKLELASCGDQQHAMEFCRESRALQVEYLMCSLKDLCRSRRRMDLDIFSCALSVIFSPSFSSLPETFLPTCTRTDLALPSWGLTPNAGEGERSEVSNRPIVLDPEPEP
ncbi:hypothetical protein DPX16_14212 [Anabarilius grahami]|uniref:Uncharacterized protein n=1 Tax=Anabarilius grahami TaxID=495550 RepID=A0A3N0XF97_ANAGA|nr:hypothetical protein DPX16_14212 [Anabarilius grahami]